LSPGQRPRPAHPGKAGCPPPAPAYQRQGHPAQEGQQPEPLTSTRRTPLLPAPAAGHDPLPGGRVKDAYGAGYAGRAPARSL